MRYYLLLLAMFFCFGCGGGNKSPFSHHDSTVYCFLQPDSVLRNPHFKDSIWRLVYQDSVYIKLKGENDSLIAVANQYNGQRFFLVSYQSMLKTDHNPVTGNLWFVSDGFPTKHEIDSLVYGGFSKKRECYQGVIVLNIYEFKTFGDYFAYANQYKGDGRPKKKEKCCAICSSQFELKFDSSYKTHNTDLKTSY